MNIRDESGQSIMVMICKQLYSEDNSFIKFIDGFPEIRDGVKVVVGDVARACAAQKVSFNVHKALFNKISKADINFDDTGFGKKISKFFIKIEL